MSLSLSLPQQEPPPPLRPLSSSANNNYNNDKASIARRILHSLNTCTSPSLLPRIHAQILLHNLHRDTTVASSFISTSISLRSLPPALSLFSRLRRPHVFVCNALLRSLLLLLHPPCHGPLRGGGDDGLLPLLVYSHMLRSAVRPNNYTLPLLLKSLSRDLPRGRALHAHAVRTGLLADLYVQNSLLNLYSACGRMRSCERLFDEMPVREVVAWSTMIMGYRNVDRLDEALVAFERMHFAGVAPNRVTMVNALAACAAHGALDMGVWIHDRVRSGGWPLDVVLGTSLVDMYGKCGRIDVGLSVFESMPERNVYTWNSLIAGLALAKDGQEALRWFLKMEDEGVTPDHVTLIGVLFACSHSNMVDTGRWIFDSLLGWRYGFGPGIKHYGCMVNLLGRAGLLDAALELIDTMPFAPNPVIWGSLLGGSRAVGDLRFSELAAKKLVELEPTNVTHYVVLSNLYSEMGCWREAEQVRKLAKEKGLRKDAGWSFADSYEVQERA